jgi:hypothetical protein
MFGPKRVKVTGVWRKLHNEELYNLHFSPDIIRIIRSRKIRWTVHVARMGRCEMHTKSWFERLKRIDHSEYLGVNGRIILKLI